MDYKINIEFDFNKMLSKLTVILPNKDYVNFISDIIINTGHDVFIKWKSKFNDFVIFDYEPFHSDGYDIYIETEDNDNSNLQFIAYILEKELKRVSTLEKLYQEDIAKC